jgi:hypothetical protein
MTNYLLLSIVFTVIAKGIPLHIGKSRRLNIRCFRTKATVRSILDTEPTAGDFQLVTSGSGRKIVNGDILDVQYTASLKEQPQTILARDNVGKFTVGDSSMISGWDSCLLKMRVGDRVRTTCPSEMAYGKKGIEGVVPPDADIELDITVLGWLGNQLRPESLFESEIESARQHSTKSKVSM